MQHPEHRASLLACAMTGVTLARSDDEATLHMEERVAFRFRRAVPD
jgi:hypothetical protein